MTKPPKPVRAGVRAVNELRILYAAAVIAQDAGNLSACLRVTPHTMRRWYGIIMDADPPPRAKRKGARR